MVIGEVDRCWIRLIEEEIVLKRFFDVVRVWVRSKEVGEVE